MTPLAVAGVDLTLQVVVLERLRNREDRCNCQSGAARILDRRRTSVAYFSSVGLGPRGTAGGACRWHWILLLLVVSAIRPAHHGATYMPKITKIGTAMFSKLLNTRTLVERTRGAKNRLTWATVVFFQRSTSERDFRKGIV
jgi:hypothetical protein